GLRAAGGADKADGADRRTNRRTSLAGTSPGWAMATRVRWRWAWKRGAFMNGNSPWEPTPSGTAAISTRDAPGRACSKGMIPLLRITVSDTSIGYALAITTSASPGGGAANAVVAKSTASRKYRAGSPA